MMSFDEFLEAAKETIKKRIPEADVTILPVTKLQGESYTGISVRPTDSNASAAFNISAAYKQYSNDESQLAGILNRIAEEAERTMAGMPTFDLTTISDYEKAKDHLVMQLIPAGQNAEQLETLPHKRIEDLAVVYRVELSEDKDGSITTLVTNHLLDTYGITLEQLHADAVAAQIANHPPVLRNMAEVMSEMSGGFMEIPESPLWVATIEGGEQGACVVQIPEFMEQAASQLGGDFFVLPSSVNEVLFIRDDGSYELEELESMVKNVNEMEVGPSDFLSNSVYHYDSEDHIFEKAVTFESRVAEEPELYGEEPAKETMNVLLVEPDNYPRKVEIGTDLEDLQEAVGGYIEAVYPFDDAVALIMNEEGKLDGLPLNRALRDEEGEIYDIIAGPFLVVGLTEDNFGSLTPEQMAKYEERFHSPEVFVQMGRGIMAVPVEPAAGKEEKKHMPVKEEARC